MLRTKKKNNRHFLRHFFVLFIFLQTQVFSVDLTTYLTWVKLYHPFFKDQSLSQSIQDQAVLGQEGVSDWRLFVELGSNKLEPIQESDFSPTKVQTHYLSISTQKKVLPVGGVFQVYGRSIQRNQFLNPIQFGDQMVSFGLGRLYENRLGLSYTQPLLKNRKGRLDRFPIFQAEKRAEANQYRKKINEDAFLAMATQRYIAWALNVELLQLTQKQLDSARDQLAQTKRKYAQNLVERLDVLRAEDDVRLNQQKRITIASQVADAAIALSLLSGKPRSALATPDFDLERLQAISGAVSFEETYQAQLFFLDLALQERVKQAKKEASRSSLDVVVDLSLLGGSDSVRSSLSLDKSDHSLSLLYQRSLQNRRARSDFKQSVLGLDQLELRREEARLQFETKKRQLLEQLKATQDQILLSRAHIKSSKKRVDEERRLYDLGKGNLNFVIQAKSYYYQTEIQYRQNLAQAQLYYVDYLNLTSQLTYQLLDKEH